MNHKYKINEFSNISESREKEKKMEKEMLHFGCTDRHRNNLTFINKKLQAVQVCLNISVSLPLATSFSVFIVLKGHTLSNIFGYIK